MVAKFCSVGVGLVKQAEAPNAEALHLITEHSAGCACIYLRLYLQSFVPIRLLRCGKQRIYIYTVTVAHAEKGLRRTLNRTERFCARLMQMFSEIHLPGSKDAAASKPPLQL